MAIITPPQNIPSEFLEEYEATLQGETAWKTKDYVRKRYPWRLPHMQGNGLVTPDPDMGPGVSWNQFVVRRYFARTVQCWHWQPFTGGVEPPEWGGRNRSWWYAAAESSGLWYYDYFIQQSMIEYLAGKVPEWCKLGGNEGGHILSRLPDETSAAKDPLYAGLNRPQEGNLMWSYIKTPHKNRYLWLYATVCAGENDCGTRERTIKHYYTSDDWHPRTITWNNKPDVGAQIGERTFTGLPVWISIWIPDTPSIVITLHSPSDYIIGFYSIGGAAEWARPFTSLFPV